MDLKCTEKLNFIMELSHWAIPRKTVDWEILLVMNILIPKIIINVSVLKSKAITWQSGNGYCISVSVQRTHITEQSVIHSYEHYHNCFITLRKLQKRTGDPFSLKAQRKRSPCPIKRGTLKPSMLLATEPLILLPSLRQGWKDFSDKSHQTTPSEIS